MDTSFILHLSCSQSELIPIQYARQQLEKKLFDKEIMKRDKHEDIHLIKSLLELCTIVIKHRYKKRCLHSILNSLPYMLCSIY